VLIAVERLLIRIRHPASRADELNTLRARLRRELQREAGDAERALALRILEAKRAVSAQLTEVSACRSCATGLPSPQGIHAGGACCGGETSELFDDRELATLASSGTRPADLTPPATGDAHAGCVFRGPQGCTLDVAHRPARCVLYICESLHRELHRGGRLAELEPVMSELRRDMTEIIALHEAREHREVLAPLVAALEDYAER
jgi:hypothetical protein